MVQDPTLAAFERLVRRRPGSALVVSPRRVATVAEVDALARTAASVLDSHPGEPGEVTGLAAPNGPGFLASFAALRRAGRAVVLLDPLAPEADRCRTAAALGARGFLDCATGWPETVADWRLVPAGSEAAPPATVLPGIAVVKLTSGSTGVPRGVATPADALHADDAGLAASMGLRDDDRIMGAIPMSHSYGLSSVVLPALVRGSLIVVPEEPDPFSPLAAAEHAGATVFPTAPAYLQALLRMSRPPAWPGSIRLVVSASAPLSPETAARFRETYGQSVHVFYGASEAGGICYDRDGSAGERGTVGAPVEGVRLELDPVEGSPAGQGVVTVVSPAVARGYVPDADPRLEGGRFQTSDIACWEAGELRLMGRTDGLINVKGKKVNPSEIETVIGQLSGVDEVVALGVPSPEKDRQLVRAVIACRPGRLSYEEVLTWCRARLPEHKVPRSVILVPSLPRNTRGKVSRAALLALGTDEGGHG